MPLIRPAEAHGARSSGTPLDLGDLRRRAELLQTQAREQARALLDQTRAEREKILTGATTEGHEKGFAKGFAEGIAKGEKEGAERALAEMTEQVTRLLEAWGDALAVFLDARDAMAREAQTDLLRVAARVGELATRRTIELDPTIVEDQLADLLGRVVAQTKLRVRVHPDDIALTDRVMPRLTRRLGESVHAEVVATTDIGAGSVIVETERGRIDSSIETRLARLIDALLPPKPPAEPTGSAG